MTQAMPPAGAIPPGQPLNYTNQPKSNPLAIVSLICGIVGCLFITPIVGIVTGVIALGKSKLQGGKGMAIAGIILSILWIVGGGIGIYGVYWGVGKIQNMVAEVAKQPAINLVNHLADGDLTSAQQMSDLSPSELAALQAKIQPLGKCTDVTIGSPNWSNVNGVVTASFTGTATFEKGTKTISAKVVVDDTVKVEALELK